MVLNVFLTGFGLLLRTGLTVACYRDAAFKKRLKEKDFLMQVRLVNSNESGYLVLRKGRLTSTRTQGACLPDLLIEWLDAPTALRSMLKIKPRDFVESMHKEISSGRLRIEFNVASSVWLLFTIREMVIVFSDSGLKSPF